MPGSELITHLKPLLDDRTPHATPDEGYRVRAAVPHGYPAATGKDPRRRVC